jgi:hypothetical protein
MARSAASFRRGAAVSPPCCVSRTGTLAPRPRRHSGRQVLWRAGLGRGLRAFGQGVSPRLPRNVSRPLQPEEFRLFRFPTCSPRARAPFGSLLARLCTKKVSRQILRNPALPVLRQHFEPPPTSTLAVVPLRVLSLGPGGHRSSHRDRADPHDPLQHHHASEVTGLWARRVGQTSLGQPLRFSVRTIFPKSVPIAAHRRVQIRARACSDPAGQSGARSRVLASTFALYNPCLAGYRAYSRQEE